MTDQSPTSPQRLRTRTIDELIGYRIWTRRILLGLSQGDLATKLGITFQQLQKIEHAKNRCPAARLYEIAALLSADLNYFFSDADGTPVPAPIDRASSRVTLENQRALEQLSVLPLGHAHAIRNLVRELARAAGAAVTA